MSNLLCNDCWASIKIDHQQREIKALEDKLDRVEKLHYSILDKTLTLSKTEQDKLNKQIGMLKGVLSTYVSRETIEKYIEELK